MDEITTTGTTKVSEVKDGEYREFTIDPASYGIQPCSIEDVRGGEPAENARRLKNLLIGHVDPYRDIVLLNAGATLLIAGITETIEDGIQQAIYALEGHGAYHALEKLVAVSNA